MNKTEVKRLLVAERKSMREKQKNSAFLRKTYNIFRGMEKRADELKKTVPFTVDELREFVRVCPKECIYCGEITTPSTWTLDHSEPIARGGSFEMANLYLACKSCNWQKGAVMSAEEFRAFRFSIGLLRPEVKADIKRRLTIGGKWGVRA